MRATLAALLGVAAIASAFSQEEQPPKPPKALALAPVILPIGKEITIQVRGDNLETATEIRIGELSLKPDEAKGGLPNIGKLSPSAAGVTLAKVKTTLPAETKPGDISITVKTPGGETEPLTARAVNPDRIAEEKEPNNGFRDAQPVSQGQQLLTGVIESENDVDVFRMDATAGDTFRIEIFAHRGGSLCDPMVTVYDEAGQLLREVDDSGDHRDVDFNFTSAADGPVFVVLQDANRYGSEWHTWALSLTRVDS